MGIFQNQYIFVNVLCIITSVYPGNMNVNVQKSHLFKNVHFRNSQNGQMAIARVKIDIYSENTNKNIQIVQFGLI